MKNRLIFIFPLSILLLYPISASAAPANSNPFPRISVGVAGLAFRSTNETYQKYLFNDNNGWAFGYQADIEFRLLSNENGAAYLTGNLTRPSKDSEIELTNIYGPTGETYTYTFLFDYRSIGARFAARGPKNSRVWIEGGGTYLKQTVSSNLQTVSYSYQHVHGWFLGVGHAQKISPFISLFSRITYISTPQYGSSSGLYDTSYLRSEYGGWSGALGLRLEL